MNAAIEKHEALPESEKPISKRLFVATMICSTLHPSTFDNPVTIVRKAYQVADELIRQENEEDRK